MNYPLISEYIEAIKSAEDNFEELSYLRPVLGDDGLPVMTGGNFAVVFKMQDIETGKFYALKCFTKEQEGRGEAYHQIVEELKNVDSPYLISIQYLDKELFVDTNQKSETEFPVLLMDWVEGKTLDKYLRENLDDKYALEMLAYRFSQLAQWLIPQPFAHGDLKPDNILVREDGTLVLIDYDGMYVPAMKGQKACELGSPDFRHPLRTENDFDELIDDFPIATISFSLNHISKTPFLLTKFGSSDRLLLSSHDYYDIDNSDLILYLYPADSFIDLNYRILKFTLNDGFLKNVELSWFRKLNKPLENQVKLESKKITIDFDGALFTMVYVEGGTFWMGAQGKSVRMPNYDIESVFGDFLGYEEIPSEGPVKEVHIDGFWISDSLVTMDVWPWFRDKPDGIYPYNIRERNKDDNLYAVSGKSYDDCMSFMRTLSKATNVKFDFPTEEEWEYAARGGIHSNGYKYSGSNIIDEVAVYGKVIGEYGIPICRVKTKKPNELGIFDMSGGLYEWCKDFSSDHADNNEEKSHFVRGGCINSVSRKCRITYRGIYYDTSYHESEPFWWQVGLRLVARNINLIDDRNRIVSLSDVATEEEILNSYTDEYGVKYSRDGTKLISAPKEIVTYIVKNDVKTICHHAFGCSQIRDIVLPTSLLYIGSSAFYDCKQLKEIIIPNNVYRLGSGCFSGCSSLSKIEIPSSVIYIESSSFSRCDSLYSLKFPPQIELLEENLFYACDNLESVSLSKVATICTDAFGNCKRLTKLTVPNSVREILDNPFRGSGITEIICETPSFVYEDGFLMNADKTELVACLTNKKYVSVPSPIKIIRSHAFSGCKTIVQVFLPDTLTEIQEYAFSQCFALSELVVPTSVKYIRRGFLSECPSVTRLVIHSKDIWIDNNSALYKTDSLTQIIVPKEIKDSFSKIFASYNNIVEEY